MEIFQTFVMYIIICRVVTSEAIDIRLDNEKKYKSDDCCK